MGRSHCSKLNSGLRISHNFILVCSFPPEFFYCFAAATFGGCGCAAAPNEKVNFGKFRHHTWLTIIDIMRLNMQTAWHVKA